MCHPVLRILPQVSFKPQNHLQTMLVCLYTRGISDGNSINALIINLSHSHSLIFSEIKRTVESPIEFVKHLKLRSRMIEFIRRQPEFDIIPFPHIRPANGINDAHHVNARHPERGSPPPEKITHGKKTKPVFIETWNGHPKRESQGWEKYTEKKDPKGLVVPTGQ